MIVSLDHDLDNFFTWLDGSIGLKNVWLALTADHGIPPIPGDAAKLGIHGAAVNMDKVYDKLNAELNKRFGKPGEKQTWLMPIPDLPYVFLDQRAFKKAGIDEKTAEDAVAALLPAAVASQDAHPLPFISDNPPTVVQPSDHRLDPAPRVQYVYTKLQLASGQLPPDEWGKLLAHSYADHGNWFVMMVLDAYQLAGVSPLAGTNHFTPWNYDRHVPLAFYGAPFKPGVYHQLVEPVDIAVTFSSLAGVNRPSAAVGHVLIEALKPGINGGPQQ